MTDTEPEQQPDPYPWLPLAAVLAWVKIDAENDERADLVDTCRRGAADWIQDRRRDLVVDGVFKASDRLVVAGLLAVARLVARIDSPNGVVSFDELGAASILSADPDVKRMLGTRRAVVG